ncbi:MAG: CopD family protein, partial [Oligoflexus sp.]|nr:CopD family protein [Oligoflexus sp.]
IVKKVQSGSPILSGKALRFLNEVPTLLMIVIVIMVIVKPWN